MKYLMIDIGAGTMDILFCDADLASHYKAVVKSPALTAAEKISSIEGDLLITGVEMGGGSFTSLLKQKAKRFEVVISRSASATINHDPEKVTSLGASVVDDAKAEELKQSGQYTHVDISDLADGRLDHAEILKQGGHGAYTRKSFGFENLELILSTGPKRALINGSKLAIWPGAPLGDNMMTGTAGLLEAVRRKKGLDLFSI